MNFPTPLIDVAQLAALEPGSVLIVDCRVDLTDRSKGRQNFLAGHVPGAIHADLDRDLSDLSRQAAGLGRHPLPTPQAFGATLSRWGWRPDVPVVCYDGAGGALAAARLWWMLRAVGAQAVAVLDGGFAAWQAAGLPLESGDEVPRTPSRVEIDFAPSAMVDHEGAARAAAAGDLLDARAEPRYLGEVEPLDRVAGHVPGAANRPFAANLQADGRFKPRETLRAEWLAWLGQRDPADVVHMCGSGVTAAHNLLAMEQAGLPGSRLYPPSWSGWISDAARPVASGAG